MITGMDNGFDRMIVEKVITSSGVAIAPQEADAVAHSLARIRAAAAILLRSSSFDETGEHYYRLLESDAAESGR